jgi:hypothetical protein
MKKAGENESIRSRPPSICLTSNKNEDHTLILMVIIVIISATIVAISAVAFVPLPLKS